MKKARKYELFQGRNGLTPYSINYGLLSKQIICVMAVSIKQAIYFGSNGIWKSDTQKLGIIEIKHKSEKSNGEWINQTQEEQL